MKKPIDIEKLVQWAVRDELPKGRAVSTEIGTIITRRARRRPFSVALQARREPDSLGFVLGAPHEDALIVSDAICYRIPRRDRASATRNVEPIS